MRKHEEAFDVQLKRLKAIQTLFNFSVSTCGECGEVIIEDIGADNTCPYCLSNEYPPDFVTEGSFNSFKKFTDGGKYTFQNAMILGHVIDFIDSLDAMGVKFVDIEGSESVEPLSSESILEQYESTL